MLGRSLRHPAFLSAPEKAFDRKERKEKRQDCKEIRKAEAPILGIPTRFEVDVHSSPLFEVRKGDAA